MASMLEKIYSTKINVIANFVSTAWTSILSVVLVPFYLDYIGIEAYGLIGIFTGIQAFIGFLDLGLSPTINVELAKLSALENRAQEIHDLKRTLELLNRAVTVFIGLLLCLLSPLIAYYWVQPGNLPVETITQAFVIMSVSIAIQFSANFYVGGLMGLQKQVLLNVINIVFGSLRSIGSLVVLAFYSPTLQAFLLWQCLVALTQIVTLNVVFNFSLPAAAGKGRFQKHLLDKVRRFAAGLTGISVGSLILMQTDKIVLSRMLSLENFGYYTLAITVSSMALNTIASSITHAVQPRFAQFISVGDEDALRRFYHRSCQTASAFLFPVIMILSLFSYQILMVWTGKERIAENTYLLLSLLAVGTGLNCLMWLPYSLQLAHNWTKLAFYVNILMICLLIPLIIVGAYRYGAVGGAIAWIALNVLYNLITVQFMHRRILKGEKLRWYLEDLALPFFVALTVSLAGKMLFPANQTRIVTVVALAAISISTFILTALSTKAVRDYLKAFGNAYSNKSSIENS